MLQASRPSRTMHAPSAIGATAAITSGDGASRNKTRQRAPCPRSSHPPECARHLGRHCPVEVAEKIDQHRDRQRAPIGTPARVGPDRRLRMAEQRDHDIGRQLRPQPRRRADRSSQAGSLHHFVGDDSCERVRGAQPAQHSQRVDRRGLLGHGMVEAGPFESSAQRLDCRTLAAEAVSVTLALGMAAINPASSKAAGSRGDRRTPLSGGSAATPPVANRSGCFSSFCPSCRSPPTKQGPPFREPTKIRAGGVLRNPS